MQKFLCPRLFVRTDARFLDNGCLIKITKHINIPYVQHAEKNSLNNKHQLNASIVPGT